MKKIFSFSAPDHTRARNNKAFYTKMLAEEQASSNARGETGEIEEQVVDSRKGKPEKDLYKTSNEFKTYEQLCRGESTQVCLYNCLFLI